jgi:hypothetical protein
VTVPDGYLGCEVNFWCTDENGKQLDEIKVDQRNYPMPKK